MSKFRNLYLELVKISEAPLHIFKKEKISFVL